MKDPDTENLDAGWDDVAPEAPPAAARIVAQGAGDLEDLDAGWDDSPSGEPAPGGRERSALGGAANTGRLSKRERREFERKKRLLGEQRRAERRAEEKRARKDAARRVAEEREAERREALERAERLRRAERKKRSKERASGSEKASRSRTDAKEDAEQKSTLRRRRLKMPEGGWIIVVIALITLATAWYAFGR